MNFLLKSDNISTAAYTYQPHWGCKVANSGGDSKGAVTVVLAERFNNQSSTPTRQRESAGRFCRNI